MLINLSKRDSNARVIIGTAAIAIGSHYMWLLIPMGMMLVQTGLTSKCPITHLLKKTTKAAQKNLFVNSLPKYNPQPVFIFKSNSQLIFSNETAQQLFPNLKEFSDVIDKDIKSIVASLALSIDDWLIAEINYPRAMAGSEIAAELQQNACNHGEIFASVIQAVNAAVAQSGPEDRVVVLGSFHVVGPALEALGKADRLALGKAD